MSHIQERIPCKERELILEDDTPAEICRRDLQTFTPMQIFFFAIGFLAFGAVCMYLAIRM